MTDDSPYKILIFLKRRPGMSVEEFREYYENHHRPLVKQYSSGLSRYVRRYLEPLPHIDTKEMMEPEFDVVTELWCANRQAFDGLLGMVKFGTLPAEVLEDEERVFDRPKTRYFCFTECEG